MVHPVLEGSDIGLLLGHKLSKTVLRIRLEVSLVNFTQSYEITLPVELALFTFAHIHLANCSVLVKLDLLDFIVVFEVTKPKSARLEVVRDKLTGTFG